MQFSKIGKMESNLEKSAKYQFHALTIELGVRKNNEWIGSGLGGNNFQLLVLMGMKHVLSNRQETTVRYLPKENMLIWGAHWLQQTPMKLNSARAG